MIKASEISADQINHLNFLAKTYDSLNSMLTSTKNRLHHLNSSASPDHQDEVVAIKKIKEALTRKIKKKLKTWPIHDLWLDKISGVGPYVASNLILLYYYRFTPICPKCEVAYVEWECPKCKEKAKGGGVLQYNIEEKDFANVSKWWSYMGRAVIDGKIAKRTKGQQSNWSSKGKAIGFQFSDQLDRRKEKSPYYEFYQGRRAKRLLTHPDISKGHNQAMSRNETVKLFLSHFWHVARTLEGKSTAGPWVQEIAGHTGIIAPYCWEEPKLI